MFARITRGSAYVPAVMAKAASGCTPPIPLLSSPFMFVCPRKHKDLGSLADEEGCCAHCPPPKAVQGGSVFQVTVNPKGYVKMNGFDIEHKETLEWLK